MKWEYMTLTYSEDDEALDNYGEQGWELIWVHDDLMYFKRPKGPDADKILESLRYQMDKDIARYGPLARSLDQALEPEPKGKGKSAALEVAEELLQFLNDNYHTVNDAVWHRVNEGLHRIIIELRTTP